MGPLTLQEVIDRVNSNSRVPQESKAISVRAEIESPHRPESYIPRTARILLRLLLALEASHASGLRGHYRPNP